MRRSVTCPRVLTQGRHTHAQAAQASPAPRRRGRHASRVPLGWLRCPCRATSSRGESSPPPRKPPRWAPPPPRVLRATPSLRLDLLRGVQDSQDPPPGAREKAGVGMQSFRPFTVARGQRGKHLSYNENNRLHTIGR